MTSPFVSQLEAVVDEVAAWGVKYVNDMLAVLAPDGRPFGMQKMTQRQQMREYMKIRGNPEAWHQWITAKTMFIVNALVNLPPDKVLSVHPGDIALRFAYEYSEAMEKLLGREQVKIEAKQTALRPPVLDETMGSIPEKVDESATALP